MENFRCWNDCCVTKMDDFQKRIGTVGALVKKGSANETKVLMPEPRLLVKRIKTSNKPYLTLQPKNKSTKPYIVV